MNKHGKILAVTALAALTLTGAAWAMGGPGGGWGGGYPGMGMGGKGCDGGGPGFISGGNGRHGHMTGMRGPRHFRGGHHGINKLLRNLPDSVQDEAKTLITAHEDALLDLKQKMSNNRFEMLKAQRGDQWDEAAIQTRSKSMAETISQIMTKRAKLHYDLKKLAATTPQNTSATPQ
ncbi:MAG: periplasmic heavy metal sensor [Magnetococcales bacterium]|nr:periplasmic heavy metal sensor [Magnetococcales bacterium]